MPQFRDALEAKRQKLLEQIVHIGDMRQGSITEVYRPCGKPNCQCANDPNAAHGPYYEWSRRENGRTVCTMISPNQARRMQHAIANYRRLQALLQHWDQRSRRIIMADSRP